MVFINSGYDRDRLRVDYFVLAAKVGLDHSVLTLEDVGDYCAILEEKGCFFNLPFMDVLQGG